MGVVLTLAAVLTLRQLALAMFQVGEDMGQAGGSSVSGVDMSGAGPQTWYQSARGGRGMCSTHAECNGRGACHRGICVCAVLWGGAHCDQALDVPATPGLPKFFTRLGAPFRGAFGMSRMNVGSRTAFEHYVFVNNPAVSHGQQVLGAVDAALLRALPSSDAIRPRVPYTSCAVVGSRDGRVHRWENMVMHMILSSILPRPSWRSTHALITSSRSRTAGASSGQRGMRPKFSSVFQ